MQGQSIYSSYYLQPCAFRRQDFSEQECVGKIQKSLWLTNHKDLFMAHNTGGPLQRKCSCIPPVFSSLPQAEGIVLMWKVPFSWQKGWARVLVGAHFPLRPRLTHTFGHRNSCFIGQICHTAKPEFYGAGTYYPLPKNGE